MGLGRGRWPLCAGRVPIAVIQGELIQNNDPALRDDLWSTVADTWFENGKDDPDVCILGLVPKAAEVWITPTSGLTFAFHIAWAKLAGDQPEMGSHGMLDEADLLRRAAST